VSRIRIYLDEDSMHRELIRALKVRGVDVTSSLIEETLEYGDHEQLEFAISQGRVLYSFNVGHFFQLHTDYLNQGKHHAGIVLAQQQRYSIGEQMRRLLRIVARRTAEQMHDRVEFLSAWNEGT
jgi:hypothetical protein